MKNKKLFHTFNHPTNYMLYLLVDEILKSLGENPLTEEEKQLINRELLDRLELPIYKSVQKFFNIQYPLKLKYKGQDLSLKEMILQYYEFYKNFFSKI